MELMLKRCWRNIADFQYIFFPMYMEHGMLGDHICSGLESYTDTDILYFIMSKCPIKREGENWENIKLAESHLLLPWECRQNFWKMSQHLLDGLVHFVLERKNLYDISPSVSKHYSGVFFSLIKSFEKVIHHVGLHVKNAALQLLLFVDDFSATTVSQIRIHVALIRLWRAQIYHTQCIK